MRKAALTTSLGLLAVAALAVLVFLRLGPSESLSGSVPLQRQEHPREELEKLHVGLRPNAIGYTEIELPEQDPKAALMRALPFLQSLDSAPQQSGLSLEFSSEAIFEPALLAQLRTLRRLVISDPKFSDLSFVARLTNLRAIDVAGTAVSNLAPLAEIPNLQYLSASMTQVSDLAPLARLKNLEVLELSGTAVADVSALAALGNLRRLDLANTEVADIAALAALTRLEELDLSRTRVKNLVTLQNLPVLRHLAVDGLGIRRFEVEGRRQQITILADPPPLPVDVAVLRGLTFRDCAECPQMVVLPRGFFAYSPGRMGEELSVEMPIRFERVQDIAVGKYEIRFDEWDLCVREGQCRPLPSGGIGRGARPVINVSWDDANVYAKWLSKKSKKTYRLLSQAEWEYAAKRVSFWKKHSSDKVCAYANLADETAQKEKVVSIGARIFPCSDGYAFSAPVGSYHPNEFGLHDMIGNVMEWVNDSLPHSMICGNQLDPANHTGNKDDADCVSRLATGGSWSEDQPKEHYAGGAWEIGPRALGEMSIGFRIARTLP